MKVDPPAMRIEQTAEEDAFQWVRKAVGYQVASSECAILKKGASQVWCKRMLEEGVAATRRQLSQGIDKTPAAGGGSCRSIVGAGVDA